MPLVCRWIVRVAPPLRLDVATVTVQRRKIHLAIERFALLQSPREIRISYPWNAEEYTMHLSLIYGFGGFWSVVVRVGECCRLLYEIGISGKHIVFRGTLLTWQNEG